MKLSLFDLHCDTAYEMLRQKQVFSENSLAVSLKKANSFDRYVQIMAFWTDSVLSDENGWNAYFRMYEHLLHDDAIKNGSITIAKKAPEHFPSIFLGIEDARILCNRLERVDQLWEMGIRFLTPLWKGTTSIGGSHDTEQGLTAFGKVAIRHALDKGMILDISHASEQSSYEIFELGAKFHRPIIATHSNAYEICSASRNLRRWQVQSVLQCGGIVGLNLYPPFLSEDGDAHMEDILSHIEYFLELGFEKNLCLGCDMDGATLPPEISNVSELSKLAELLLNRNYTEELVKNIFFENAYQFSKKI